MRRCGARDRTFVKQAIHPSKKRLAFKEQFRRYRHTPVVFGNDGGNLMAMCQRHIPNLFKYGGGRHNRLPQGAGGSASLSRPPAPGAGPLPVVIPT
jgi:hypothetical protein